VAVIGHHNDELLCELCDPPLSSVVPNARRIGYVAAQTLDLLMRGRRIENPEVCIPPKGVVARQSTDLVAVDDPRLARAVRFLRAHAFEPIGVEEIARAAGMSRSLLERRFRPAFGDSPWNYVLRLRVDAARHLLLNTSLSLTEIAERTGFGTPEYFSAAFRKLTGSSPREARGERR
jgi:LacI family transcriptional regulator